MTANTSLTISNRPKPTPQTNHLHIGALIFERIDQSDFTAPFEVLCRVPDSTIHILAKTKSPIADMHGLILTPQTTIAESPDLDVLLVPGGYGQQDLMEDEEVLSLIRNHYAAGKLIFSVCTGALLCGAAGILRGRQATTHWAAWDVLPYYGAIPSKSRVVVDGNLVSAAGVTAGLDGALVVASLLRGDAVAEQIQLGIQYAPDPIFNSGSPETASPEILKAMTDRYRPTTAARQAQAQQFATRHNIPIPPSK
jgi:cyclohexyl-isocyanide hydratase